MAEKEPDQDHPKQKELLLAGGSGVVSESSHPEVSSPQISSAKEAIQPRAMEDTQTSSSPNERVEPYRSESPPDPYRDVVEIYLQQAQAYCDEKQWDKAKRACQEALQVAPNTAEAYKLWGNILQQQGERTDAMGCYAKAIALQPNFPEVYSNLGSLYAYQKQWDRAIGYYQKAIEKDPSFAIAYLNLSKVWRKLKETEQEIETLAIALRLQPELGTAKDHYRIGQFLESSETEKSIPQQTAAICAYRQAVVQDPKFIAAYKRLADLLEDQSDWEEAVACYRKVLELESAATQAGGQAQKSNGSVASSGANGIGGSRRQAENPAVPPTAITPFTTPPSLSEKDQQLIRNLVRMSSRKKLLQPGNSSGNQAIASAAKRQLLPSAHNQAAHMLPPLAQQVVASSTPVFAAQTQAAPIQSPPLTPTGRPKVDPQQAIALTIKALWQAIRRSPQSVDLYRNLAKVLVQNKQPQQAAQVLYRAFVLDPSWPTAQQYVEVGNVLAQGGKTGAAINCYRQAIKVQPALTVAYQRLAQLLESQNKSAAAKSVLQQLSAFQNSGSNSGSNPADEARSLHQQGESLREQGQWEGAIAAYQGVIARTPNFSWAHHSLGDCYKKLGRWAEAAGAYRSAIAIKADFVWSYYSLAEVSEKLDQWEVAAQNYRQVLAIAPENEQAPPRLAGVLQKLLQQAPRNVGYYTELAEQLIQADKADEAIAAYQMALQIQPENSAIALTLSKLLAQKDPQQAHALLDRALSETVMVQAVREPQDLSNPHTVEAVLKLTHLFDPVYYRATNPQVMAADDQALLLHYIQQGSAAGRNPNPLFDDSFYRSQHPEIVQKGINPLAHYHCFGYKAGFDPHPFFNAALYCETHPDVAAADINPLEHYLAYGAKEGRAAFFAEQFAHILHDPTPADADYLQVWKGVGEGAGEGAGKDVVDHSTLSPQTLGIYCNSLGNYFITEIADFIADALRAAGHTVVRLSEHDTPPEHLDGHWVVAPHEFFYLGEGVQWTQKQQWLSEAVMVNVEQPQTTWFSKAFHFLRHTKTIFDINVKSAAIMQTLGLPAYWMPFGYLPDYEPFAASEALPNLLALRSLLPEVSQRLPALQAPLTDRPIDLHFIGTLNPRREAFFAESAGWLSQFRCFLHIPPMGVPLLKGQDQALDTEAVVGLSRRSKILLNIHRDELPYFEWHRMVFHGLWQNTLVVTEPCHDIPGLVSGEHFIECSLADMPSKVAWLLQDAEGQIAAERIRQTGHQRLKELFNGSDVMTHALQIIAAATAKTITAKTITEKTITVGGQR